MSKIKYKGTYHFDDGVYIIRKKKWVKIAEGSGPKRIDCRAFIALLG